MESLVAILLPTLAVFREIANGKELIHMGAATVDLLVGAVFAAAWILLLDFTNSRYTRAIRDQSSSYIDSMHLRRALTYRKCFVAFFGGRLGSPPGQQII